MLVMSSSTEQTLPEIKECVLSLDDDDDEEKAQDVQFTLCAGDGGRFEVSKSTLILSDVLSAMTESGDSELPVPEVKTEHLALVVTYLKNYKGKMPPPIPKPLTTNLGDAVDPWALEFIINMHQTLLVEIIQVCAGIFPPLFFFPLILFFSHAHADSLSFAFALF